jgi:hypothetical protein
VVDRVWRDGIRLNPDVSWVCGGDSCVDLRGLEHETGAGSSEDAIEGEESDEDQRVSPTIDPGLYLLSVSV